MNESSGLVAKKLKPVFGWINYNLVWLLLLSVLVLFTSKAKFNLPIAIMTLIGLFLTLKHFKAIIVHQKFRYFMLLFASIVIPLLLSLPDAVNLSRASSSTLKYMVFPFIAIYALTAMGVNDQFKRRILLGLGIIVSLWVVDGLAQYFFGHNILGDPYDGGRVKGMFYPKQRLGTVTAALSPVLFDFVRQYARKYKIIWILVPATITVVILSASRNAWIMLAVSGFLYFIYIAVRLNARAALKLFVLFFVMVVLIGVAAYQIPYVKRFANMTALLAKGDFKSIDKATSYRLSLWQTAYNMAKKNPINGIGPRGFRYVYMDYAEKGNFWKSQTHPHQMTLEIFTETGIIGIIGYLVFWILMLKFLLGLSADPLEKAAPWALAATVAIFPINSHMAFYGNYWSTITWWLLIIMIVMANTKPMVTKMTTR